MLGRTLAATALGFGLAWSAAASAQETLKIGVIVPFSGPFADAGAQLDAGIKLYMQQHGDEVAGKKIEIIRKDTGGPAPDVAKRLAQELVVRDQVDVLAGFALTPEALGAADVASEAKKLDGRDECRDLGRHREVALHRAHLADHPAGQLQFRQMGVREGRRQAGLHAGRRLRTRHDAERSFARGFTEAGGTIVGADKTPVANPDFSAFVQRVKDANPEAVYIFIPGGAQPAAIGKALSDRGLTPPATKILGQGELTHPEALESMGETARGIITTFHYTLERDDPVNNEFVKAYRDANGGRSPDLFSIGGYDGMHLIYEALKKTNGDAGGDALVEAAKGMSWTSPRGPMSIDPETRDTIQTVYIREVQEVDGKLQNVIIEEIPNIKDPLHGQAN